MIIMELLFSHTTDITFGDDFHFKDQKFSLPYYIQNTTMLLLVVPDGFFHLILCSSHLIMLLNTHKDSLSLTVRDSDG